MTASILTVSPDQYGLSLVCVDGDQTMIVSPIRLSRAPITICITIRPLLSRRWRR